MLEYCINIEFQYILLYIAEYYCNYYRVDFFNLEFPRIQQRKILGVLTT